MTLPTERKGFGIGTKKILIEVLPTTCNDSNFLIPLEYIASRLPLEYL